ncbi:hypothetical protein Q5424_27355 [Conexibacter sp. JD483]|uniref:hypothetical protein n=1 Tax=unclassified Conexibacter TaxID=2627773 RepID=UPI002724276A|nr:MULTISPECIES: hypothetical protein [unclassified Conexibacter]MDO8189522.1 hypothetical protein [Conexibacter sp. CPCC 205706]MDO8198220.1 hypothetical protein [Conexibacter sp. CPCC 205762]MDR9372848.1 hypothetical protein [Conexibacter sp. JD483]
MRTSVIRGKNEAGADMHGNNGSESDDRPFDDAVDAVTGIVELPCSVDEFVAMLRGRA